jgi:hypothetical protein
VDRLWTQVAFFLAVCLAVGMVNGACRSNTLRGVSRESLKSFVELSGGIALLCLAVWLVSLVAQA